MTAQYPSHVTLETPGDYRNAATAGVPVYDVLREKLLLREAS